MGKYRVLARKITGHTDIKDVEIINKKHGFQAQDVFIMKDVSKIVDVHGVLESCEWV